MQLLVGYRPDQRLVWLLGVGSGVRPGPIIVTSLAQSASSDAKNWLASEGDGMEYPVFSSFRGEWQHTRFVSQMEINSITRITKPAPVEVC
ncbi:hypothetical protein [Methylobacillus flagellatus]|uniref:Uncharacterized protein n=1 Tax=Methylobacillus flagellatus (strain ATCC 51484 / DSM 6875 / VKM B-1610 / KT) TaxID=265072 RepID=Q1H1R9_METFK|nr:hypothetical protein [Methylobacillus flagellatus]ABE49568.1 hypothetical protein Mfla_1300 [Methylobacillus flagellatus KT]